MSGTPIGLHGRLVRKENRKKPSTNLFPTVWVILFSHQELQLLVLVSIYPMAYGCPEPPKKGPLDTSKGTLTALNRPR